MKTESEIRWHRDNLKFLFDQPCTCAGTAHAAECQEGGRLMLVEIVMLGWILGDDDRWNTSVDHAEQCASDRQSYPARG